MEKAFKKIVVLAPHTDDGEFGCGGSIAKFLEQGSEVYYVAFSTAKKSVPEGLPQDVLEKEVKEATKRLGIKPENLIIYGFEVRKLNYVRQDILEEMVRLKKEINPDLVFMPSPNDLHQDHTTVAMEGIRAFKQTSILAYEVPWNNLRFETQCFVKLEEKHMKQKTYALDAYNSQKTRFYAKEDFIYSLSKTRGVQVNTEYTEAFEVIRWII
ncbi:MAG: PIG-L family deacetylase [Bacteroidales bacterium]|nr:PIG-L family deacetylase [Bacteroidales bacterium]MCF8337148.1 PIG-L family deacetylase [Bacteroidales bacterium]